MTYDASLLDEVVDGNEVLLVWSDTEGVDTDSWLNLIGVIKTLDVVQVADVKGGNVVGSGQAEVQEFTVGTEVAVDSNDIASLWTKIKEELSNTLRAVWVEAEWIDDPNLTESDSCSNSCAFCVAGDELDVLDTATVGDGDGADDLAGGESPETESVGGLDTESWLQGGEWDNEVGGQDDVLVKVNGETVGAKLILENVGSSCNIED